ncbi:type IV toxin-antitoxin system AbiEi family antitoxin domain-containing protein [Nocardioides hwasunensis]|uniref:Type IV toxin-antitoxin system AbiEi family antitoxin domain-containing protein n=1 Tax=Nocardioides hwasunensis TaxID=397258 RepID=A0ABR8MH22_9ACTN|nr:type IV toxin-antitoxin system AbiEi family antitoxin domain-containing protein [Nocardioides hwasunensis]MBD3915373.1 type IV toxin-antitoxin system AbiEi family antitoxin domain-containing protein [Nocardioides hwasunensis]
MDRLAPLLSAQGGVVSRRQALEVGLLPHDLRRLVRRRELAPIHPGVFVDHTGSPTWLQHAWAAVLFCAARGEEQGVAAALGGASAMRAADGPGRGNHDGPIVVAIPRERRVVAPVGIRVVRTFALDERVLWNLRPPRMTYDEAALDVALETVGELDAVGAVARAVQGRHTTAARMLTALGRRSRAPRRDFLVGVLSDVASGACSVLEREYLERVERPHFLPAGRRQLRVGTISGVVYRDNALEELLIELDGRLFHDTAEQRDADHERDLDAAVTGQDSVRLTWGQVVGRPCSTAAKVSAILESRGLRGGRRCGPGCGWVVAA